MAGIVAQVNLPRTRDLLFRVEQQLFPLRNPAGGAGDSKQDREHGHREAHGLVDEPGIEVHVGIELALYEVIFFQGDALALQSDFQQRIFAHQVKNPLLEIALECERIALEDDYFIKRKLYPNVDFYTGLIYQSMGFPMTMFPVLFAIPRTSGWISQWEEMLLDPEQKIARPRQIYLGHDTRHYVPIDERS